MSAVSRNVTPASSAASTTARVPASSTRRPKLLQPSPTTLTVSSLVPRRRVRMPGGYRLAPMLHSEDFHVGDVTELGTVEVTEEDVIAFDTPFGGLIASGWHTTALFMGLFVRGILLDSALLGSPGVEAIRWTAPVRPGDTLSGRVTVTDSQPSATNPRRGTVVIASEVFNQRGELVM